MSSVSVAESIIWFLMSLIFLGYAFKNRRETDLVIAQMSGAVMSLCGFLYAYFADNILIIIASVGFGCLLYFGYKNRTNGSSTR